MSKRMPPVGKWTSHIATDLADAHLHHVEATPRPEIEVTASRIVKPGRKRKCDSSALAHLGDHLRIASPRRSPLAHGIDIEPSPSSCTLTTIAAAVASLHTDDAAGTLPRATRSREALFVVDGIANEMAERRVQLLRDFTVHRRVLTRRDKLHLATELTRGVAHEPRHPTIPSPTQHARIQYALVELRHGARHSLLTESNANARSRRRVSNDVTAV